jgi:Tol biopolymer transport system component/DNA-binding winged helix-turn-helix (wHTH) protein
MSSQNKRSYEFGPFRIDTLNRQLRRDGELVPLKAKAVDTLLLLIQSQGDVVEKDDLMKLLWPDSFVEEANLTQHVYTLRKALGEGNYIETIPRRGYRFVGEVKEWDDPSSDVLVIQEKTRTSISYEEQSEGPAGNELVESNLPPGQAIIDVSLRPGALQVLNVESRAKDWRAFRRWWPLALLITVVVIGVVIVSRLWRPHPPFERVQLTRFTTTGKAEKAAISPDGKYLAHVFSDSGQQSVWLRQVATGKDLQIIAPAHTDFYGLTFSHDGNYIYYVSQEMNHLGMLFQVPSLGGNSTKLAEDVDSPVTLSPDDKQLAFIRLNPAERSIIIANVDGSGERKLTSTSTAANFKIEPTYLIPPAWSPDGKTIACPVGIVTSEDEYQTIWGFQTETGVGRALTSEHWQTLGRMEWLATGAGIVVTAAEKGGNFAQQIWYVNYPDGAIRKITNDLNDYRDLSVSADARTIITVQSERRANIWATPADDLNHPKQITFTNYDALDGLSWAPDGKLVYTQQTAGEQNLWVTDLSDNTTQLTSHAGFNLEPAVSPDGRYIVFVSTRSGRLHLWRIDADGKHPVELTHGVEDRRPSITPDSQQVLFRSIVPGVGSRVFRVAIGGGQPIRLTDRISAEPIVSPDGKWIAIIYRAAPAAINKIAVMPSSGGEPKLICDLPAFYGRFRWTPDGSGLAYAAKQEGIGNIWIQPVDGSAPKQLTHWSSNPILSFDWSRDGKWLAYSNGTLTSDVVLITDVVR